MICDSCEHKKTYTTGFDEYPPHTEMEYCSKLHWVDHDYLFNENEENLNVGKDYYKNCPDFEDKLKKE